MENGFFLPEFHAYHSQSVIHIMFDIPDWASPLLCVTTCKILHLIQEVLQERNDMILQLN